jgi:hypothetical protein
MKIAPIAVVVVASVGLAGAGLARAESLASSAASVGSSASLTASSASDSIGGSSNSSKGGNTARAGDYRIEAITHDDTAGKVRLTLAPRIAASDGDGSGFVLALPRGTFDAQRLARGDLLALRERPYGFEIARGDAREPFFLVLADAWHRELDPRPVTAGARAPL